MRKFVSFMERNFGVIALGVLAAVLLLYMICPNLFYHYTVTVSPTPNETVNESDQIGLESTSVSAADTIISTTQQYRDEIEITAQRREALITNPYNAVNARTKAADARQEEEDALAALDVPDTFTKKERVIFKYIWGRIRWDASLGRNKTEIDFELYGYEWTTGLRQFVKELGYTIEAKARPERYDISW